MASESYEPGFVQSQGFGQSPENPAPSLFLESIAIDKDCSVYGSLYITNNVEVGKNVTIKGNLQVSGPGTFGGVVSAAGFTYGGKSFFGSNQFVVEAPATFLNSLSTAGSSTFQGLLTAATGIISQTLSIPPQSLNNQSATNPAIYQPTNNDGEPNTAPLTFVPCLMNELPLGAVVLAYVPQGGSDSGN